MLLQRNLIYTGITRAKKLVIMVGHKEGPGHCHKEQQTPTKVHSSLGEAGSVMTELKNEFSWSKTRDEIFKTCPRQYWFAYYGYWNGWLENAPERTRQIYVLKNLKNRQMWAGEKVHECIQRSFYNIRRGIKVLPIDEIVSITIDQMRAEFRSSKSKNYWKNPKSCGLLEHEYEVEVSDEEWKEAAGNVETCLRNFYASDIYDGLKSHLKDGWLEVEEFSSFYLDDIKINLVIGLRHKRRGGRLYLRLEDRKKPFRRPLHPIRLLCPLCYGEMEYSS